MKQSTYRTIMMTGLAAAVTVAAFNCFSEPAMAEVGRTPSYSDMVGVWGDDVEDYNTEKEKSDSSNTYSGPGALSESVVDDFAVTGPSVKEFSLSETYHEDYEVYEESMGDIYFFYASVANGGITDKPVTIDIPRDLSFTMEKDGEEIAYQSGQLIGERGAYTLRLQGGVDPTAAFSEQTVYKAVFRFRIQEKSAAAKKAEAESLAAESKAAESLAAELANTPDSQNEGSELETTSESGMDSEDSESSAAQDENYISDDGTYNDEAIDAMLNDAIGSTDPAKTLAGFHESNGLAEIYDKDSGFYNEVLLTGSVFYSNVSNGMVTNNSVSLKTIEDEVAFRVLKDGTEIEYTGEEFTEDGSYTIFPSEDTTLFISYYNSRQKPLFCFRIITNPISDLGIFNAPLSMEINRVTHDEEVLDTVGDSFKLELDGVYQVELKGDAGTAYVSITKDTRPPRYRVNVEKNRATVQYLSSDVSRYILKKGETSEENAGQISEISGAGAYQLFVYDKAGNDSAISFNIKYALNTAALMGIALVLVLIIVGILFARNINKKVAIR